MKKTLPIAVSLSAMPPNEWRRLYLLSLTLMSSGAVIWWVVSSYLVAPLPRDAQLSRSALSGILSRAISGEATPWFFFRHNALVALGMCSGAFLAGVPTVWLCLATGLTLASTLSSLDQIGVPSGVLVAALWAHAPIELLGFAYASAVGLTGVRLFRTLLTEQRTTQAVVLDIHGALRRVIAAASLLMVAAVIEAWLTPRLLHEAIVALPK